MSSFAIRGQRVLVAHERTPRPASLYVREGVIAAIGDYGNTHGQREVVECGETALLPGVVDCHAHINEPGRTDWEGFASATRAAAAGGITTIVDMPLNSIPATTTLAALNAKREAARSACRIDYAFWGGVVPGNAHELEPMARAGVVGFKCFLCESGVPEFKYVGEAELREAMPILARLGLPLIAHAEIESPCPPSQHGPREYAAYLDSRPPSFELNAIRLLIRLARETHCRTHIVHLSTAEALKEIGAAKEAGVPLSVETCPHYLCFEAEQVPDGSTAFKCAPPIRDHANREALWQGLKEGTIDFIVSDHSPCVPALKTQAGGDFAKAWGGIAGLQFSLSAVWTQMRARGFSLGDLARLMCHNTARFTGLAPRKGALNVGADADLLLFADDETFTVNESKIFHRHKLTPYLGQQLQGVVRQSYVRGERVWNGQDFNDTIKGQEAKRSA